MGFAPVCGVILVHGLWVPGFAMSPFAARLARFGLRSHTFSYQGRARPVEAHAERLARFAHDIGPADFVGHSLGGLVILEALGADPAIEVKRVVLLGTPASGCYSARRFARHAAGRWLMGASEPLWHAERVRRWSRPEPLGVVAGSMPIGLGRLAGRLHGPNDGVVSLEETAVEGMAERIVLRVSHSAMLVSGRVAAAVATFLEHGRFRPGEP